MRCFKSLMCSFPGEVTPVPITCRSDPPHGGATAQNADHRGAAMLVGVIAIAGLGDPGL